MDPNNTVLTSSAPKKINIKFIVLIIALVVTLFAIILFVLLTKKAPVETAVNSLPTPAPSVNTLEPISIANTVSGVITDISDNSVTITTLPLDAKHTKDVKTYNISITQETEINKLLPTPPDRATQMEKITVNDLSKGMYIALLTDLDINKSESLKALKIDLLAATAPVPQGAP